jgi:dolichyldiphosphatase
VADSDLPMAVSLLGATTSAFVSLTFYAVLAWHRDATMVAFFLGSISNGVLSKILKKNIQQGRPPELQVAEMSLKPSDGGMPSSHAMSLGFIGTFTALHLPWTRLPLAVYVAVSLWYRVRVKLHTPAQIAVGVTVGAANALCFETLVRGSLENWLQSYILNDQGLLPLPLLVVPAIVGVLLVGSFERRIGQWLEQRKQKAL